MKRCGSPGLRVPCSRSCALRSLSLPVVPTHRAALIYWYLCAVRLRTPSSAPRPRRPISTAPFSDPRRELPKASAALPGAEPCGLARRRRRRRAPRLREKHAFPRLCARVRLLHRPDRLLGALRVRHVERRPPLERAAARRCTGRRLGAGPAPARGSSEYFDSMRASESSCGSEPSPPPNAAPRGPRGAATRGRSG